MILIIGDDETEHVHAFIGLVFHLQQDLDVTGFVLADLEPVDFIVQNLVLPFVVIEVGVEHHR